MATFNNVYIDRNEYYAANTLAANKKNSEMKVIKSKYPDIYSEDATD